MSVSLLIFAAAFVSEGQPVQVDRKASPVELVCWSMNRDAKLKSDRNTVCATRKERKQYRVWLRKQEREAFPISGR